jgi:hypothetical protein
MSCTYLRQVSIIPLCSALSPVQDSAGWVFVLLGVDCVSPLSFFFFPFFPSPSRPVLLPSPFITRGSLFLPHPSTRPFSFLRLAAVPPAHDQPQHPTALLYPPALAHTRFPTHSPPALVSLLSDAATGLQPKGLPHRRCHRLWNYILVSHCLLIFPVRPSLVNGCVNGWALLSPSIRS